MFRSGQTRVNESYARLTRKRTIANTETGQTNAR